jgi:hypothetical protein
MATPTELLAVSIALRNHAADLRIAAAAARAAAAAAREQAQVAREVADTARLALTRIRRGHPTDSGGTLPTGIDPGNFGRSNPLGTCDVTG